MERISWIDWIKATAVVTVVFCHLPQSQDWFYYRYLQTTIITVFFFVSGYLKKDRANQRENWRKYWHSLVVPYLLLNAIIYPFWIAKFAMTNGAWPSLADSLRPIVGALLFQHESSYATHLNGALWYLPAVLMMHLLIDATNTRRSVAKPLMVSFCILSVLLYAACKYWGLAHNLTPIGFLRRLPFYYLGYLMGRQRLLCDYRPWRDAAMSAACLLLSLPLFYWHLHEERLWLHLALFYAVSLLFVFTVVFGCKLISTPHRSPQPNVITTLSIGTLLVIGLHEPLITVINYAIRLCTGITTTPLYHWYEALPLALLITALLYPVILWSMRHLPILMGRS